MKTKSVGKRESPKTPEEFHALGAKLDLEAKVVGPPRRRGFVFKARTWEELERWERNRSMEAARQMRAQ
ncbi:MAG TPA: hypothetical protein VF751_12085 [Chthoniobacterales bacterium]